MDKQGKAVPYIRTTAQINAALANVEANKNDQKGKGGGKGKNTWGSNPAKSTTVTCFHCGEVGHYVADCPQKANGQPPQGKGADKGKTRKG